MELLNNLRIVLLPNLAEVILMAHYNKPIHPKTLQNL